jgi:hypothetical protein
MEIKPFARYVARTTFCFDVYNVLGKFFVAFNEKNSIINENDVITRKEFVRDIKSYLKKRGNPFSELEDAEKCIDDGFAGPLGELKIIRGDKLEKKLVEEMERDREGFIIISP